MAPFFFVGGWRAVIISLALSGMALCAIGAGISLFTGRGLLFSAARQLVSGYAAAAVTFGIGHLAGVALG